MACSPITKTVILAAISVKLFVLGLFIFITFPETFVSQVYKNLAIAPTSPSYVFWLEPPLPIYAKMHLFNITNPEDVEKNHSKPIVEEMGPYVYREFRKKILVTFNNDNDTVSYRVQKSYEFAPELTVGSLDDVITTLNVPAMAAAYATRNAGWVTQFGLNGALTSKQEKVFITTTVNKILFEGTQSGVFDFAKSLESFTGAAVPDKFGWFYGKNYSDDGRWSVHTGKNDVNRLGEVDFLNYVREQSCWPDQCGKVSGTTGEQFNPTRNITDPIAFYAPDLKRSLSLDYDSDVDVNGIAAYRYKSTSNLFANGTHNPDNACYDPPGGIPTGVLNMSACSLGAPVFLSLPHFLHADECYGDAVEGLDPRPEDHSISFFVNPTLGAPVKVAAKLQLNVLLTPVKGIRLFQKVPTVLIPMLWIEQTAALEGPMESRVKMATQTIPLVVGILLPMLLVFISFILLICAVRVFRGRNKNLKTGDTEEKYNYSPIKMTTVSS